MLVYLLFREVEMGGRGLRKWLWGGKDEGTGGNKEKTPEELEREREKRIEEEVVGIGLAVSKIQILDMTNLGDDIGRYRNSIEKIMNNSTLKGFREWMRECYGVEDRKEIGKNDIIRNFLPMYLASPRMTIYESVNINGQLYVGHAYAIKSSHTMNMESFLEEDIIEKVYVPVSNIAPSRKSSMQVPASIVFVENTQLTEFLGEEESKRLCGGLGQAEILVQEKHDVLRGRSSGSLIFITENNKDNRATINNELWHAFAFKKYYPFFHKDALEKGEKRSFAQTPVSGISIEQNAVLESEMAYMLINETCSDALSFLTNMIGTTSKLLGGMGEALINGIARTKDATLSTTIRTAMEKGDKKGIEEAGWKIIKQSRNRGENYKLSELLMLMLCYKHAPNETKNLLSDINSVQINKNTSSLEKQPTIVDALKKVIQRIASGKMGLLKNDFVATARKRDQQVRKQYNIS